MINLSRYKLSGSFRKYSRNTAWIFAERIIRIIFLIPVMSLMVRYLGPEKIGTFNLAVSLVAMFAIVAPLGIPSILVREIVRDQEKTNRLVLTSLAIRLIAAAVFYIALLAVSFMLGYSTLEISLISIIGFRLFFQSFDSIDNYLQAVVKMRTSSKIRLIAFFITSGLKLYLVFTQKPLLWFAYVYAVEFIVIALQFLVIYYIMTGRTYKVEWDWPEGKRLIIASLPLVYYTALLTVNMKIDQVMISKLIGNEGNGYYSVVVSLIETLYFIPVALGTSLFPGLIKQHKEGSEDYERSFLLLYELMLLIAAGIAIVFIIGAPLIIGLLFGKEFTPSIPLLQLYALCPVLMFYGYIRSRWLIIEDLQKYSIWFLAVALIVNVGLNLILLPVMGLSGAVVALLASYITSFLIVPFIIPSTRISVIMFFRAFRMKAIRDVIKKREI